MCAVHLVLISVRLEPRITPVNDRVSSHLLFVFPVLYYNVSSIVLTVRKPVVKLRVLFIKVGRGQDRVHISVPYV